MLFLARNKIAFYSIVFFLSLRLIFKTKRISRKEFRSNLTLWFLFFVSCLSLFVLACYLCFSALFNDSKKRFQNKRDTKREIVIRIMFSGTLNNNNIDDDATHELAILS